MSTQDLGETVRNTCQIAVRPKTANFQASAIKIINVKRLKVLQFKRFQKKKNDLYQKLTQKLENQLKAIKNHNTPQARQKLVLLQKCRNQKHIRRKTKNIQQGGQLQFIKQKKFLHRPMTCCSRMSRHNQPSSKFEISQDRRMKNKQNEFNPTKSQNNVNLIFKLDEIQKSCQTQCNRYEQIRQEIETAVFYQRLISKNFSRIFTKIL